jgi:hypothetical protein
VAITEDGETVAVLIDPTVLACLMDTVEGRFRRRDPGEN